jgi:hypothetical protein
MINFHKFRRIYEVINDFIVSQSVPYSFKSIPHLQAQIITSLGIEPVDDVGLDVKEVLESPGEETLGSHFLPRVRLFCSCNTS